MDDRIFCNCIFTWTFYPTREKFIVSSVSYYQNTRIELIKLLYQQIRFALWGESLAAIGLVIAMWGAVNNELLLGWLAFNLLLSGLGRHILVNRYQYCHSSAELTFEKTVFWEILFAIGVI